LPDSNVECLIDGIEWSCNGRYAFCAISVKSIIKKNEGENVVPPN